ncbi:unnamed protein product [Allacma fusca]|uniref:Gamma-aminobutyric acid receptor subunit beta n=1 Tax=Allacma fusca TaxID=39272 RepID=A0A8J2KQ81_9HEXA|nr:unnamed protein product [Allacma fusca]
MWVILCLWNSLWTLSVSGMTTDNLWNFDRTDNVTQTISHILKTYDVRLRPNFGGDPLYIGIQTTLDSFLQVSEVNMDFTITIYLNQYWKDERLAFSSNDETLTLPGDFAERIWVPDTFFANDKHSFLHDVTEKNKMVRLHGDGSVMYGMRFTTTLSCMMDLHYYPLDSQNCTVEIESYGYTTSDLVMYWKGDSALGTQVKPPQFQIVGIETINRIVELATGVYQRLSLSIAIRRETSYFIFQTYLPSILIVMLSWISFWINHEAVAARVALGITTVLTMTTLSSAVRASLPRISYVKAIDIYLVMCFVFVFAALLEYATVNNAFWEKRPARPVKQKLPKTPKIEVSRAGSVKEKSSKKSSFGSLGHRLRDHNMKRSREKDPLYAIEILDTPFTSTAVSRIPRSTSFSGTSGVSHTSQNLYVHSTIPMAPLPGVPKVPWRQRKLARSIRKKAGYLSMKDCLPQITQDVNVIDKYSRVAFPLAFIVFNIIYWGFYHENG